MGQYPYEHIKSVEMLDIPLVDLRREHFDSQLTLNKLSEDERARVQRVISSAAPKASFAQRRP